MIKNNSVSYVQGMIRALFQGADLPQPPAELTERARIRANSLVLGYMDPALDALLGKHIAASANDAGKILKAAGYVRAQESDACRSYARALAAACFGVKSNPVSAGSALRASTRAEIASDLAAFLGHRATAINSAVDHKIGANSLPEAKPVSSRLTTVFARTINLRDVGLRAVKMSASAGGRTLKGTAFAGNRELLIAGIGEAPSLFDADAERRKSNVVEVTPAGLAFFDSWEAQWSQDQQRQRVIQIVHSHNSKKLSMLGIAVALNQPFDVALPVINECLRDGLLKVVSFDVA